MSSSAEPGASQSLRDMIIEDKRSSRSWFNSSSVPEFIAQDASIPTPRTPYFTSHEEDGVELTRSRLEEEASEKTSFGSSTTLTVAMSNDDRPATLHATGSPHLQLRKIAQDNSEPMRNGEATPNAFAAWWTRWVKDWWALELGSMVLGTISIVVVAILLLGVDGDEMPQWQLGITVDTVLSLLAGFSKSCLLMPTAEALGQIKWTSSTTKVKRAIDVERIDKATRGTWGSLVLIIRARGVTLASLGAAIILLSVPLDLCFRQIVRYPVEPLLNPHVNASLARATLYNPPSGLKWMGENDVISEDDQVAAFIYSSWLSNETTGPDIKFDCPTGNCTFAPFHTLGVDYQCEPLPLDLLSLDCRNTSAEWHSTIAYNDSMPNMTSCGYYLDVPGHVSQLVSGYEVLNGTIAETLAARVIALSDAYTNELYFNGSISFQNVTGRIIDFIMATTPESFHGARTNGTPTLEECEVHWVVKEKEATVLNGNLQEHTRRTMFFPSSDVYWDPMDPNVYTFSPSMTLHAPGNALDQWDYGASNITARKIWQAWSLLAPSSLLRTSSRSPVPDQAVYKAVWLQDPPRLVQLLKPSMPWEYPGNVSTHMARLVSTVDQVIRRNVLSETGQRDVAIGQVYRNAVMVRVNWAWFAFPATLWTFAVTFLTITIWRSSTLERKESPYKSSLLPLLLDRKADGKGQHMAGRSMASLRKQAKTSTFELQRPRAGV